MFDPVEKVIAEPDTVTEDAAFVVPLIVDTVVSVAGVTRTLTSPVNPVFTCSDEVESEPVTSCPTGALNAGRIDVLAMAAIVHHTKSCFFIKNDNRLVGQC